MAKVFLSYSRKDSRFKDRLKNELKAVGFNVWTDEGLEPGTESWQAEIEKEIEECNFMTVLLSPAAKKSKWVRREVAYGASLEKRIYPVLIAGDEKTAFPLELVGMQYIDLRTNYERNIHQFLRYLSRPTFAKYPDPQEFKSDISPLKFLQQAIEEFRANSFSTIFFEEGTSISRLTSIIENSEATEEAEQLNLIRRELVTAAILLFTEGYIEMMKEEKSHMDPTALPHPSSPIWVKKRFDLIEISISRDLFICRVWDTRYIGQEDGDSAARLFEMGYLNDISRPRTILAVKYEISKKYSRESDVEFDQEKFYNEIVDVYLIMTLSLLDIPFAKIKPFLSH